MVRTIIGAVASILLAVSVAQAKDELSTSFGFVTQDPFLAAGEAPRRNDITLLGGVFVSDSFGGAAEFWDADYMSSYMLGAVVGRDFYELGGGFLFGGVVGGALRFGDDDPDTTAELWAGLRLRHQGLLIGNLLISPGLTAGFSAVTGPNGIEREHEIRYDGDATFLGYIGPELAFRWRTLPKLELVTQLHHRSGGAGTFGNMGEGSNAWTWGVRFKF